MLGLGCRGFTPGARGAEIADIQSWPRCYQLEHYCGRRNIAMPERFVLSSEKLSASAGGWELAQLVVARHGDDAYAVKPRIENLGGCLVGYWRQSEGDRIVVVWSAVMTQIRLVLSESDGVLAGDLFRDTDDLRRPTQRFAEVIFARVSCNTEERAPLRPPTREECGATVSTSTSPPR
jgi:hypothetical protein